MLVLLCWVGALMASLAAETARADVGLSVGPHGGVALSSDAAPFFGLGLRLTAPSSPLTIQPRFDYVLDETQTLYHVSGNVLYEVPTAFLLKPYFGAGMSYSTFALNQPAAAEPAMNGDDADQGVDDEGHRLGMNLLAGARLELPWLSPFVQVSKGIGEFDALAIGGGLELSLRKRSGAPAPPEPMRFAATPLLGASGGALCTILPCC